MIPTTTQCDCGAAMQRHPRANGLTGHVLTCDECSMVRVFESDGREVNLATGGFKRKASIGDKECACAECVKLSRVKGLCNLHNTRWGAIKLPRFGDTYRAWCAAGGPSKAKWEVMQ